MKNSKTPKTNVPVINNLVAKHMGAFCKAVTMKSRKGNGSYSRKSKYPERGVAHV